MSIESFDQAKLNRAAASLNTSPEKLVQDFEAILSGQKVGTHSRMKKLTYHTRKVCAH